MLVHFCALRAGPGLWNTTRTRAQKRPRRLTAGAQGRVPLDHHRRAEGGPAPEYETEQRARYLIRGAGKPELIPKQLNAVAFVDGRKWLVSIKGLEMST